ncbi:MAG: 3-methyl-2-oxobutanoate hydroxymethyltransferase [bacterium]
MKTIPEIQRMKNEKRRITALTCYDFQMAKILDEAGIDIVLVGDSLGMVVLGYENTLPVTMDEMLHHTKAVKRGIENALLVGDMPFMSYKVDIKDSVYNAGRMTKEGGASAVKLEGGIEIIPTIKAMLDADIPVMGHIGLRPQAIHKMGGYKVQRDEALIEEAFELERAGIFSLVLECIPGSLAKKITESLKIPTIGIGSGIHCDGQILVLNDMIGLTERSPKFVRKYLNMKDEISRAIKRFIEDVLKGDFPRKEESYE